MYDKGGKCVFVWVIRVKQARVCMYRVLVKTRGGS